MSRNSSFGECRCGLHARNGAAILPARARRCHAALLLTLLLLAGAAPGTAAAAPPTYTLTPWTTQSGLPPGDVLAITEDLEGYLWLGTSSGLVRFDGSTFVPWQTRSESIPADRSVPALVGSRDGSLWIGYGDDGGVARVRGGTVTNYAAGSGLFAGAITVLFEDRQGVVWAGGRGGLSRFRGGQWESVGTSQGYDGAGVYSVYEDRTGRLWLGTAAGVYASENTRFELRYPDATFVQGFAEDSSGTLWATDTRDTLKRLDTGQTPTHGVDVRVPQIGWRVARDARGDVWIAALGGGVLRLAQQADGRQAIERFSYEGRIVGSPRSVFYDREGNVWIGMRGGLLRVAETTLDSRVALTGLTNDGVRAIAAGDDGSVWIATGHSLNRFVAGRREAYAVPQTRSLETDHRGTLWISTATGLMRFVDGRPVAASGGGTIRWEGVMAMASDDEGAQWLCTIDQGVLIWRDSTLTRFAEQGAAAQSCSQIYTDRRGRQWIGYSSGGLTVRDGDTVQHFGTADGLASGGVLALLEDRSGAIWVVTRAGLSRFQKGRFTTVSRAHGPFADLVASLVEDDDGYIWIGIASGAGVMRLSPREMDRVAADARHPVEYAVYDVSDGMLGEIPWQQSRAAAARGADGRLWFATGTGVAVIDPHNLPSAQRPLAPRIEQVAIDGRTLRAAPAELPSATSTLSIGWGTVSLAAASKLRFRYRLEGIDADWVLAEARRSISYAHLPSGRYRFRLAATTDGVWTEAPPWEFSVAPPFYLSRWFVTLVGVVLVAAFAAAWWLRFRSVRAQYAVVFAERARVSREIHDTLLQSLAAIGMELETIAHELDPGQSAGRESLRRLRRQASHSLREARDMVVALRQNGSLKARGLVEALREIADQATATRGVPVDVSVTGRVQRCDVDVELQLLRICQEAVNNAIRHGGATRVEIAVDFRGADINMRVIDNGSGFVTDHAWSERESGEHFGLLGMSERAERISGQLTITSAVGAGTVVEATAPLESR